MSQNEFNLQELQKAIIGAPKDLIIPENHEDNERDNKQHTIRKIVDMYHSCRSNQRIYKSTYDALSDDNPFVRVAAADLICKSGTKTSFDYLFKALEDEENSHVKKEIAMAINKLEAKLNNEVYEIEEEEDMSFIETMRILSFSK